MPVADDAAISSFALGSSLMAFYFSFNNSHLEISGDEQNGKDKEGMAV
jgi:hypothetical protein